MGSPSPHLHVNSVSLEGLPLHLLEYICTYLPRRSVFPFSLVSRRCYQASTPQRLSRLTLHIYGEAKLHDDLEQWNDRLGPDNRFRYIRRVAVVGNMVLASEEQDPYRAHGYTRTVRVTVRMRKTGTMCIVDQRQTGSRSNTIGLSTRHGSHLWLSSRSCQA
jgi:hypothetical protein